jgi:type III secretion protein J
MKPIVALLLALLLAACSRHAELMSSIAEAEANDVIAALQNAGIDAAKTPGKDGMVSISIEAAQVGRAMDLLRSKGLPRERHAGMGQVFKKEGLISSPLEERARYIYALSQELDATLSQIDGVMVARVHVVLPERGAIGDPVLPSSAAVFIKYQDGYNLDALQPQIRRLVNNSIPGLAPEKISIVLFSSQPPAIRAAAPIPASNMPLAVVLAACALAVVALGGWFGWNYVQTRRADALIPSEG